MQIHFLGTGAGMPSKSRNTSALLVNLRDEGEGYWLFDCGEATQHQILHTSIKPRLIQKIFITHLHGDHIFGLPGLLSSRSFLGGDEPLQIYGPKQLIHWIEETLKTTNTYLTYPIEFIAIEDQEILFENERFIVKSDCLAHVVPSYGFRIEQKPLAGQLYIEKALAAGVPKGPLLGQLKKGFDVTLANGKLVTSDEVTGPPQEGFTLTILGDTAFCEEAIQLSSNADLVVHEATFADDKIALAKQYGHSTIGQAATIAKKSNAKALIVNHLSARYVSHDISQLKKEGASYFEPIFIAEDFSSFTLKGDQVIESFGI